MENKQELVNILYALGQVYSQLKDSGNSTFQLKAEIQIKISELLKQI